MIFFLYIRQENEKVARLLISKKKLGNFLNDKLRELDENELGNMPVTTKDKYGLFE